MAGWARVAGCSDLQGWVRSMSQVCACLCGSNKLNHENQTNGLALLLIDRARSDGVGRNSAVRKCVVPGSW